MPEYSKTFGPVIQALSTTPEYMFGRKDYFEPVVKGEKSMAICLAATSETHGVRGFIATVVWPPETTAGAVEIQGADQNEEQAFHPLGSIEFPARQYSSPSGLVINFMRMKVTALPAPEPKLAGRLTIR